MLVEVSAASLRCRFIGAEALETPHVKAALSHDGSKKLLRSGLAAALAGHLQTLWFCCAQIREQDMIDLFLAVWNIYWPSNLCWYL